ncbi:MAG: sigma 54-interacting transcriptional regulator [Myxococcales bacterium]|nr:sigma 54-interacting transcriptional regulator [Myxococcales bacterium]
MDSRDDQGEDVPRAFLVLRYGDETRFADLPLGSPLSIGSGESAGCRIADPAMAPVHASIRWDGEALSVDPARGRTRLHLNGRPLKGSSALKTGDELRLGDTLLVVGISMPLTSGGRRTLTHQEFRERLCEELARASRRGCTTSLVMLRTKPGDGGRASSAALATFRAGDVIAIYAPDELEFLLPDATAEEARRVVKRVIERAETVGIVGLAEAPAAGEDPDRVLRVARLDLMRAMRGEEAGAASQPSAPPPPVTQGERSRALLEQLIEAGRGGRSVLLSGELSTGKVVFAHQLHLAAGGGPFVRIECTALAEEAAARRAFGGPEAPGASRAASARGGTLVLEEVGDLPPEGQRLLLGFIEREGEGLRIVSTTQRVLAGLVERGAFDASLYRRLALETLEIEPLRNRPDDILPMAERFCLEEGAAAPARFSPGALARLHAYPWPGNVLELRNAMERAVRLAGDAEILAEHLPSEPLPLKGSEGLLREHVDGVERDAIVRALADSNHNQTHAARRLGVSRRALIYKMEKYGLKRPPERRA